MCGTQLFVFKSWEKTEGVTVHWRFAVFVSVSSFLLIFLATVGFLAHDAKLCRIVSYSLIIIHNTRNEYRSDSAQYKTPQH